MHSAATSLGVECTRARICRAEGCTKPVAGKRDAFCRLHVAQGRTCGVDGCNKALFRLGMCMAHAQRKMRGMDVNVEIDLDPAEAFILAASDLVECCSEDDAEYKRLRLRVLRIGVRWLKSLTTVAKGG